MKTKTVVHGIFAAIAGLFGFLMLLLQPIWIDIESALAFLGSGKVVLTSLIILSFVALALHTAAAVWSKFDRRPKITTGLLISGGILSLLWLGLSSVLLMEMGNELGLILVELERIRWWLFVAGALLATLIAAPKSLRHRWLLTPLIPLALYLLAADIRPHRLLAPPTLEPSGTNSVSVQWVSNQNGVGTLVIHEENGTQKKIVPSRHGLIEADSRFHRAEVSSLVPGVPFTYHVESKRVKDIFPCNIRYGSTAVSETYTYTPPKNHLKIIVLNDIHEKDSLLSDLIGPPSEAPDLVVFNGDAINHLESENHFLNAFYIKAAKALGGTTPFVYVRGNHDTRGRWGRELINYLASPENRFYYGFTMAGTRITILDAGECHCDDHYEYGGLADFAPYRETESDWIREEVKNYGKTTNQIAFCHIPFDEEAPDDLPYLREWEALFSRANLDLLTCGHTHEPRYAEPDDERSYLQAIGGGDSYGDPKEYHIVEIVTTPESLSVTGRNYLGETFYSWEK